MKKKNNNVVLVIIAIIIIYFMTKKPKSTFKSGIDIPAGGSEQLSKNFNLKEFHSHDGADMPYDVFLNIKKLANHLQVIRDQVNKPIKINSAYRSPEHNEAMGGKSESKHLLGMASDISVNGVEPKELKQIIEDLISEGKIPEGGLGLYSTFVHYDFRGTKARW